MRPPEVKALEILSHCLQLIREGSPKHFVLGFLQDCLPEEDAQKVVESLSALPAAEHWKERTATVQIGLRVIKRFQEASAITIDVEHSTVQVSFSTGRKEVVTKVNNLSQAKYLAQELLTVLVRGDQIKLMHIDRRDTGEIYRKELVKWYVTV